MELQPIVILLSNLLELMLDKLYAGEPFVSKTRLQFRGIHGKQIKGRGKGFFLFGLNRTYL